eukprot:TRINITY_DN427_c0_g2_i2.p1 TRINITY_DN427_c0_g2~~TRINITY_DN427_c0_g2_i2.p1  ORF type:complete len:185 (+),score=49.00 TRINITY_DN427_c0_g2_i2:91-645(+)
MQEEKSGICVFCQEKIPVVDFASHVMDCSGGEIEPENLEESVEYFRTSGDGDTRKKKEFSIGKIVDDDTKRLSTDSVVPCLTNTESPPTDQQTSIPPQSSVESAQISSPIEQNPSDNATKDEDKETTDESTSTDTTQSDKSEQCDDEDKDDSQKSNSDDDEDDNEPGYRFGDYTRYIVGKIMGW